ncbi:MAG: single-stranded-DNA-specific exonuclease RecJ [Bacteroidota bacterium]
MFSKRWILKDSPDPDQAEILAEALSTSHPFPSVLAEILLQRNITTFEEARKFFLPDSIPLHDPMLMADMDLAVHRLIKAREKKERVLLYGDYDVDGTSAVTMLSLFLEDWAYDFDFYIPDRYAEGYGVSFQGIDYAVKIGAALIVSLDCGIKAHDKVRYANSKGIDFIICDHHTPAASLPEAVAVLDPMRKDDAYPYKYLTGCGVGFKLAQALSFQLQASGFTPPTQDYDPLARYSDLVALSIACDIVPITGENRAIAFAGMKKLQENPLPGIKALMDQAGESRQWDISDLVFFVGPRVNAAGRLGHARDAVQVLLGKDAELKHLAEDLQVSNDERKGLDKEITTQALAMIAADPAYAQKHTTVLTRDDWHKGVIGIVASRLIERHYRPTILLTESEGKLVGSARSVPGFDLYQALEACEEYLVRFGGHKYAAGMTLKPEDFPAFCKKFDEVVGKTIHQDQKIPVLYIDRELRFSQINARFIRLLQRMAPFGPENRKPVFRSRRVKVMNSRLLKEVHLKLVLEQENGMYEAIGFGLGEKWAHLPEPPQWIDIAYQPMFNTWNGRTTINLRLKDFEPSHEA